jgi:hypothetical protein
VIVNSEFNLRAVNPIIECLSRDLVTINCQGLQSSAVYTAPPVFGKTLSHHSNWSVHRLQLHMHTQAIISTFLTSNCYIILCLPKALTLTQLWSYEIFEVVLIFRITNNVGVRGILNLHLLRDTFPYRLG